MRFLLLLSFVAAGCAAPLESPRNPDEDFIGLTLAEVIEALQLTLDESPVIEEPEGVVRGVSSLSPSKEEVLLYFRRGAVPSHQPDQWTLEAFKKLRVIGIARRTASGWEQAGEVIWYYDAK